VPKAKLQSLEGTINGIEDLTLLEQLEETSRILEGAIRLFDLKPGEEIKWELSLPLPTSA